MGAEGGGKLILLTFLKRLDIQLQTSTNAFPTLATMEADALTSLTILNVNALTNILLAGNNQQ